MDKITFYGSWSIQVVRPWPTIEGAIVAWANVLVMIRGNDIEPGPGHWPYYGYETYFLFRESSFQVSGQQWELGIWEWDDTTGTFNPPLTFKKSASFTHGDGLTVNLEIDNFVDVYGTIVTGHMIVACTCLDPSISLPPLAAEPLDFTLPENVKIVESHGKPERGQRRISG